MSFITFQSFVEKLKIKNEKGFIISCIRSDHGRKYKNVDFESFCDEHEIEHNFSAPITPQQNEVVESKNITLLEMARTMLHETICQLIFEPKQSILHVIY